jgi:hypothetical protein
MCFRCLAVMPFSRSRRAWAIAAIGSAIACGSQGPAAARRARRHHHPAVVEFDLSGDDARIARDVHVDDMRQTGTTTGEADVARIGL